MPKKECKWAGAQRCVNRVILGTGNIWYIHPFVMPDDGPDPDYEIYPQGWNTPLNDHDVAFYVEEGASITLGMLVEALGSDWVVDNTSSVW
jgi:hypothetical protein